MDTFLLVLHQDCAATCGNTLLRVQNIAERCLSCESRLCVCVCVTLSSATASSLR